MYNQQLDLHGDFLGVCSGNMCLKFVSAVVYASSERDDSYSATVSARMKPRLLRAQLIKAHASALYALRIADAITARVRYSAVVFRLMCKQKLF